MSRRPNERDLARAEQAARERENRGGSTTGAKATLLAKFGAMADSGNARAERARAAGIEPAAPSPADLLAGAERIVDDARTAARDAQQRMIERSTGRRAYLSGVDEHRAAHDLADLRHVEAAKLRLRIGLDYRAEMRRRSEPTA